jgi:transcriptional regulator with XRE-family HTH domain
VEATVEKYQPNYIDYSDPHESNEFWIRLQQVFDNSNHSLESLAKQINCSKRTLERFLSKQTHGDVLKMIYDISFACGVDPKILFDRTESIPNMDLTGIKSIDRMLITAYSDVSETGVEGFRKVAARDYRLRHHRWRIDNDTKHDRIAQMLELDDEGYPSLPLDAEIKLNAEVAERNDFVKQLFLHRAHFAGEMLVVHYTVEERKRIYSKRTIRDALGHTDYVWLEKPLAEYKANGRLVPKIRIRQWTLDKKFRLEVA